MKYIYTVKDGQAKLLTALDEGAENLHIQDTMPAKEYKEGYESYLTYDDANGVHWGFKRLSGVKLREKAYQTRKVIRYNDELITVDEANKLWLEYQAEGSEKAVIISSLIAEAKANIRKMYPDELPLPETTEIEEDENEFIGADSEVGEEQFGNETLGDEDPLLNVEIVGEDIEDDKIIDEIQSMGNID